MDGCISEPECFHIPEMSLRIRFCRCASRICGSWRPRSPQPQAVYSLYVPAPTHLKYVGDQSPQPTPTCSNCRSTTCLQLRHSPRQLAQPHRHQPLPCQRRWHRQLLHQSPRNHLSHHRHHTPPLSDLQVCIWLCFNPKELLFVIC